MSKGALYTVSRVRKDDTLYGALHGSTTGAHTICGFVINETWWVVNNTFDGVPTCPECLKLLRENLYHEL